MPELPQIERDLIAEWVDVRGLGYQSLSTQAERLGVPRSTLEKALARARQAGDSRVPPARIAQRRHENDPFITSVTPGPDLPEETIEAARRYVRRKAKDADVILDMLGISEGTP